jgi:hypothetical protein
MAPAVLITTNLEGIFHPLFKTSTKKDGHHLGPVAHVHVFVRAFAFAEHSEDHVRHCVIRHIKNFI